MYIKKIWKFKNSIEIEKYNTFRYKSKGQKRNCKSLPTKESVKKNNRKKAADRLRRLIKANFEDGFHLVLTYNKNDRPDRVQAERELKNFIRRIKYRFKKAGDELKAVMVTEYENKAIHHHLIINNSDHMDVIRTLAEQWRPGNVNFTMLYQDEDVDELAEYLIKETDKTFRNDECNKQRYTRTRNLSEPQCKVEIIKSNSFSHNPKVPDGYELKKSSLLNGISETTGYPYQRYTLLKINKQKRRRFND